MSIFNNDLIVCHIEELLGMNILNNHKITFSHTSADKEHYPDRYLYGYRDIKEMASEEEATPEEKLLLKECSIVASVVKEIKAFADDVITPLESGWFSANWAVQEMKGNRGPIIPKETLNRCQDVAQVSFANTDAEYRGHMLDILSGIEYEMQLAQEEHQSSKPKFAEGVKDAISNIQKMKQVIDEYESHVSTVEALLDSLRETRAKAVETYKSVHPRGY